MDQIHATDANTASMDEALFRQLFTSTYSALVAYARRRSVDPTEADDVVAEVYATAWRRRADIPSDTPALPWLYGIAANVLRNSRRAGSRRLQLVERLQHEPTAVDAAGRAATGGDPAQAVDDSVSGELGVALDRLSWDDQEVLRLVTWEGLSHAEAGQALGCSTNAVGIRIHRARQRLEQELNTVRSSDEQAVQNSNPLETDHPRTEQDERQGGADQ